MIHWCNSTPQRNWVIKSIRKFNGATIHQKQIELSEIDLYNWCKSTPETLQSYYKIIGNTITFNQIKHLHHTFVII